MNMRNAWTLELDDPQVALGELWAQLEEEGPLLAHSAGFITCSYDYIESGVAAAVAAALPFPVVGCTTLTNAMNRETGAMLLCLSVLTAQDCTFSAALSAPLDEGDLETATQKAYQEARGALPEEPGLILAFMPMMGAIGGELILNALDTAVGGLPIFGTIACDFDTAQYSNTFTFCNGTVTRDAMALLLISGNIKPRFVMTATSEQNIHKQQAVITASAGSVLKGVNGVSALEYFRSIGLTQGVEGMSSIPFVVDYKDGTPPVARAIYSLTDEGYAICGGTMPEGGTLSIGRMDVEDILLTAEQSITTLLADEDVKGIIAFPCLGRNMVLGVEPFSEVSRVRQVVGGRVPWHLAYSGGEICPVYTEKGETRNRFHNFTFIACGI